MRQNAKKPKPNPNNNPRRSTSIRAIIGDRRFDQFRHVNNDGIEGTNKVKRMEVHDLPNLGQNGSSNRSGAGGDPRGGCGDLAAKTSEYAFFKRIKTNTFSDRYLMCRKRALSMPNLHRQMRKNKMRPIIPFFHHRVVDQRILRLMAQMFNMLGLVYITACLRNKGIFYAKREKLRQLAADRYNVKEVSSEGFDLVSALISRILPVVQDNNTHRNPKQDEIDSECKLPPFPELESATQIKNHEAYKRKLVESQKLSCLDDGFCRPTKKLKEKDLLEWNPTDSFSCDDGFCRPTKKVKEKDLLEWNPTDSFSCDDGFCRPTKKLKEKNLLEWNPTDSFLRDDGFCRPTKQLKEKNLLEWNPTESFSCRASPNCRIGYNCGQTEGYNRKIIKSHHRSCLDILEWNPTGVESSTQYNHNRTASGFRIQNFDMEGIVSFDEPLRVHESRNFQELDESRLYAEPKLLGQPQRLLLGWDDNSEKDESFLASSPFITRYIRKEHLLTSSVSSYTPKHLMAVEEDCSTKFPFQDYNMCCLNESFNMEENRGSESFLFLIQSPASKPLSFLDTGLHSLADDENEENFVYGSDQFLDSGVNDYGSSSYMESFFDKHFDHTVTDYPSLLHDSSRNDEF
ncbi:uncharacterized protein LOC143551926 [Bidens hawaiensis]|uniref:uncharacterized protein LOC143551926 n=1 Tax=Bidens hawaiensis TaxID=980011 RepID=UPI00404B5193